MESNDYAWPRGFAHRMMGNPGRPDLATELAAMLDAIRLDSARAVLRLFLVADVRDLLPQVRQPTLVLQTRESHAVPMEASEFLARLLPEGRVVVVDPEGHLLPVSVPDDVVAAIRDFL